LHLQLASSLLCFHTPAPLPHHYYIIHIESKTKPLILRSSWNTVRYCVYGKRPVSMQWCRTPKEIFQKPWTQHNSYGYLASLQVDWYHHSWAQSTFH
jgi:hypothetical protein